MSSSLCRAGKRRTHHATSSYRRRSLHQLSVSLSQRGDSLLSDDRVVVFFALASFVHSDNARVPLCDSESV